jgi:hypothetical protein
MPKKVIDFSKLSEDIRQEPWDLHFWESTPTDLLEFLKDPRKELADIGIQLRPEVRVEITIENLDWIARTTQGFTSSTTINGDPILICGTGGGGGTVAATGKDYYKILRASRKSFGEIGD